jgi:hypothetical protein
MMLNEESKINYKEYLNDQTLDDYTPSAAISPDKNYQQSL